MAEDSPLSEEERAELEQLRAEKAAREQAQKDAAERAELERLREEQERSERERAEDERIAQQKARGRELMEPDDDLKMPLGQKIALVLIVVFAIVALLMMLY